MKCSAKSAKSKLTADGWKRYEYALELTKGQLARREPADFAVTVSDEARVLIDQCALVPPPIIWTA